MSTDYLKKLIKQKNSYRAEISMSWIFVAIVPLFLAFVFFISILSFDTYDARVNPLELTGNVHKEVDSIKVWVKIQGDYVVSNISGYVIKWLYNSKDIDTSKISQVLKKEVQKRQLLSFLRKKDTDNLSVTIIADGNLRYMHVLPLVQAMANVGISEYRFQGEKALF